MRSSIIATTSYYQKHWSNGISMEVNHHWQIRKGYFLFKRVTDIAIALLVCLLIFPWLFPIIIVLIKLDSRGPIFFKQKRVGFLEQIFHCYKFRTMYVNDAADTRQAVRNDPRVTRIGKFLRNTGLDELPQFINVLLGHMSIVGPRPHMIKDTQEFAEVVSDYKFRHLVRPGITGMAQVRGYRGQATTFQSIFRRYQWDAFYVRNNSFWLDCKIITETGLLMLQSLFQKDKPLPDNSVTASVQDEQPMDVVRKIA